MTVNPVRYDFNMGFTPKNTFSNNVEALIRRWGEKFGYYSDLPQRIGFTIGTHGPDFYAPESGGFVVAMTGSDLPTNYNVQVSSDLFEKIADDPALIEKYEQYIKNAINELNKAKQTAESKGMNEFIRHYTVSVKPDGSFQAGIRMWNTYLFNYNNVVRQSEWNGQFRTSRLYPEDLEHIGHSPEFITGGSFGIVFGKFHRVLEGIPDKVIKLEIEVKPNRDTFTFFEYDYRNRKKPTIFDFL